VQYTQPDAGIPRSTGQNFIFLSTAATYGVPDENAEACHENLPTAPINAYGTSKLMSEMLLRDLSAATGLTPRDAHGYSSGSARVENHYQADHSPGSLRTRA